MEMTVGERIAAWTPTYLVTLHQIYDYIGLITKQSEGG